MAVADPLLVNAIASRAVDAVEEFTGQALANLAWAFAHMLLRNKPFFTVFQGRADQFGPQGVANTLWAVAKLAEADLPLVEELAAAAVRICGEFSQQNLSNSLWALAIMIFADRSLIDSLAQLVVLKSPEFRAQGIANTMWAFACLRVDDGPVFAALGAAAKAEEFSPQNLANTVWAVAKLSLENPHFVASLFASVEARREEFHAQHLVSTAWALATFRYMNEPMMKMIAERLVAGVLEPQDLSNTVWAFAKLAFLHFPLMAAISSGAKSRLVEFSEQNLTNTAWAFATLGVVDSPLIASLASSFGALGDCSAQGLANMSWALASLEMLDVPFMHAIAQRALPLLKEFKPQELTNMSWAFATLAIFSEPMFEGIAQAVLVLADGQKLLPHDLSGLAWSFAALVFGHARCMAVIGAAASRQLTEFKPQDLSNTAWAFATLRMPDVPLLRSLAAASGEILTEFDPQDLSNSLWAFAKLEISLPEPLVEDLGLEARSKVQDAEPQNLAMTAWAFATFGIANAPLMESIAAAALGRLEHFASRDLANLLWSFPTLELQINRDILANAHEILALRLPTEAADVQQKALNRMREPHVVAEVFDFLTTLLELSWALAFAGQQQPRLAGLLRSSLRRIAAALDDSGLARHSRSSASDVVAPAHLQSPKVVLDLPDIAVVLKPPHWEVDARPKEELQVEDLPGGAARISRFLQGIYASEKYPLLFSEVHQYGIIHRLDVPSSGLILVGKTFVGYFALRWQQDTYELGRHYLVLCHGHFTAGKHIINARIKTSKTFPATSRVSAAGKPAWTQVEALCLLARGDQPFSLLLVLIRTGRTHQIRVHLQHAGHPTVCDEKYTDPAVFAEDVSWCPRNFLHRFELTFQDCDGQARAARAALPEDLQAVLATLRAIEGEEIRSALLRGWVPEV